MVGICICFPEGTLVTTKDHGVKKIENLRPFEKLQTLSSKGGVAKWTTFYTWGHRESERVEEFVVLKVEQDKELIISSEHLLFIANPNGGGRIAKKAGQVGIGDNLFQVDEAGVLHPSPVIEIGVKEMRGLYAPFTMDGSFFANGFLVGCYANISDFDVAHAALAPLRLWYKIKGNYTPKNKVDKEGIHEYARNLMKVRSLFPNHLQHLIN